MSFSARLQQMLRTTRVPIWMDGRIVRHLSESSMTGAQLTIALQEARRFKAGLDECVVAMEKLLDEGETVEEHKARIAAEDADPATAAKAMGWFAIEDFAALCGVGPTGFARHISGLHGQIVKPRSELDFKRMVSGTWHRCPSSGFYYADYFHFAESWTDALAKARKEQSR